MINQLDSNFREAGFEKEVIFGDYINGRCLRTLKVGGHRLDLLHLTIKLSLDIISCCLHDIIVCVDSIVVETGNIFETLVPGSLSQYQQVVIKNIITTHSGYQVPHHER